MRTGIVLALLAVAAYAIYKHQKGKLPGEAHTFDPGVAGGNTPFYEPPGVPGFTTTAAPNRPEQVLAASQGNTDQVTEFGYAPAFGADENQPTNSQEVMF